MTALQLQVAFQRELNQFEEKPHINTNDVLYWLNQSVNKYVNNNLSLFETDQYVTDALNPLVREETLAVIAGTSKPYSFTANLSSLSSVYRHRVGEEVGILYTDVKGSVISKRQGVTECTVDTYRKHIDNPFSEHRLHYTEAKPLRLIRNNLVELITDGSYSITNYYIRFIKEPATITYSQTCDLASFIHPLIVKQAVDMAIENIGDTNRLQTHSIETKTMG